MDILVTGGAGFIGSHLVEELLKSDNNIIVVDDFSTGKFDNIQIGKNRNISIIKKDLLDYNSNKKFDKVYHLASDTNARNTDLVTFEKNIELTKKAITLLKKEGKFIYTSSCSIYGNNIFAKETSNFAPVGYYAISKVIGEKIIQDNIENYIIYRFGNIYGEKQDGTLETGILAIIKNAQKTKNKIKLFNKGETWREYVYVKDLISYMLKINRNGIFNIGTGKLIKTMDLITEANVKYIDAGKVQEPKKVRLNIKKLLSITEKIKTKDVFDFIRGE